MSGLKTFSCVVVLCGAMANTAIADPMGVQWVVQWE